MIELIKVQKNGVDARDLFEFLGETGRFRDWIRTTLLSYDFEKGNDYQEIIIELEKRNFRKDYILSLDTAKELAMLSKTVKGKEARNYFIKCEKVAKEAYAVRQVAIETRKGLTDRIKDAGENERMNGFAYPSYTLLVYKTLGIDYKKMKKFRETLSKNDQIRVDICEKIIGTLLQMGENYETIKNKVKLFDFEKMAGGK